MEGISVSCQHAVPVVRKIKKVPRDVRSSQSGKNHDRDKDRSQEEEHMQVPNYSFCNLRPFF